MSSLQVVKEKLFKLTTSLDFYVYMYPVVKQLYINQNLTQKSSSLY